MRGDCWGTCLIMLGFMDLGWLRVCRRPTSVLFFFLVSLVINDSMILNAPLWGSNIQNGYQDLSKHHSVIFDHNIQSGAAVTWFNSFGPNDAIWRQRSGSTLAQVMACCQTASVRSSDIHLRASSQEITQPSITEIIWKINKYLKFH